MNPQFYSVAFVASGFGNQVAVDDVNNQLIEIVKLDVGGPGLSIPVSGYVPALLGIGGSNVGPNNPIPVYDGYLNPITTTWTNATSAQTYLNVGSAGYDTVVLTIVPQGTILSGVASFEVFDGSNWLPIKAARTESYSTDNTYNLTGTSRAWQIGVGGFPDFRCRLSTAVTGTGSVGVVIVASSTPDASLMTVGIDPSTLPLTVSGTISASALNNVLGTALTGQVLITVTGSSVQGPNIPAVNGVVVIAHPLNSALTATIGGVVGTSSSLTNSVAGTGSGAFLQPGASLGFAVQNASQLWFNGIAGDKFSFAAS